MFPLLHYVLLALVLVTASSLSVKAQVTASEKSPAATTTPALPRRIPMVAADYVAPEKQPPSLERVGVNDSDALPLSLNEAIRLALENERRRTCHA